MISNRSLKASGTVNVSINNGVESCALIWPKF